MSPRLKRSRPNLRMLRLLAVLALLLVIVFGVRELACGGGSGAVTTTTSGAEDPSAPTVVTVGGGGGEITVGVGEPFSVEGMTLVITSFAETGTPSGARYPMDDGPGRKAGEGESFYQAFARAENGGESVVRVDPRHFSLDAGGPLIPVDPARTGPGARSLLQGASFDFILTFLGPAGLEPRLVYRPDAGGTVVIEAAAAP